jgi:hypothetical protein
MASNPLKTKESGYVPGFEEDLFISYGHFDNAGPAWLSNLHEQLELRLKMLLGEDLRIWRDSRLTGEIEFRKLLQRKVSRSALFLSVLSPRYVISESCGEEVRWFLESARKNGGICVESQSRVVRVLKTPLQGASEPEGLRDFDTLGFRFYKGDDQDFSEFPATPSLPGYTDFYAQVEKLSQAINRLLRRMRTEKLLTVPVGPKAIFLATTTKDLKEYRESIKAELAKRGHSVKPETTLPTDLDELRSAVQALLPSCDISVHLFGQHYGTVPEGETRSVDRLQYEWIREHPADQLRHQILWVPEDLNSPAPKQAEFLQTLQNIKDQPGVAKVELFRTGLASFKEGLLDIVAQKPCAHDPGPPQTKSIYLLCDQRDLSEREFQEIRGYLLNLGFPVDLPAFEGDPGELREAEKMSVCDSDAIVIYYGNGKDVWVKLKRRAILTLLAEAGKKSVRALYLSGPCNDTKRGAFIAPGGVYVNQVALRPSWYWAIAAGFNLRSFNHFWIS